MARAVGLPYFLLLLHCAVFTRGSYNFVKRGWGTSITATHPMRTIAWQRYAACRVIPRHFEELLFVFNIALYDD